MIKAITKKIIAETLNVDLELIDDDASQKTLENWDSLRHLNLMVALEDEFDLSFKPEQIASMTNLNAIIQEIQSRQKQ